MNKICILKPHIANQIAAGEVVERPASVIKELMENAMDAGATQITVEIQNGGLSYMRVADNGVGIAPEDCLLAFVRHATSKISTQDDLTHIETLGFRGEALASIAAVAQVELRTRAQAQDSGMCVRMEGGERKFAKPIGCPQGTTIEVENLFFNVPARKKFLNSARSEASAIGDYVSRMILAKPDISIRYINNGSTVYRSQGDGKLKNTIYCIYGEDALPFLKEIDTDSGYMRVQGFIGTPQLTRPNRMQQSFFLNGRFIRSSLLSSALQDAYGTLLMSKQYPFVVLHITISSREVDVNVHPNKLDVRFSQQSRVKDAVCAACAQALALYDMPSIVFPQNDDAAADTAFAPQKRNREEGVGQTNDIAGERLRALRESMQIDLKPAGTMRVKESLYEIPQFHIAAQPQIVGLDKTTPSPEIENNSSEDIVPNIAEEQLTLGEAPIHIVGQVFQTYWFVQQGEGLYLIDQHAAHERKLFDRMMQQQEDGAAQTLLIPSYLQLTPIEFDVLEQHAALLRELGFDFEPDGPTSIRLFALPAALSDRDPAAMLREAVDAMRRDKKATTLELKREAIIQASCKHAVKAGDMLTAQEISELLQYFIESGTPMTCPHGRPVIVKITRRELEKMFRRTL